MDYSSALGHTQCTYICPFWSVEIVRIGEADMGVGDDTRVVEVVYTSTMREQSMGDDDVSFLGRELMKPFARGNVGDQGITIRDVEPLGVVQKVFADPYGSATP